MHLIEMYHIFEANCKRFKSQVEVYVNNDTLLFLTFQRSTSGGLKVIPNKRIFTLNKEGDNWTVVPPEPDTPFTVTRGYATARTLPVNFNCFTAKEADTFIEEFFDPGTHDYLKSVARVQHDLKCLKDIERPWKFSEEDYHASTRNRPDKIRDYHAVTNKKWAQNLEYFNSENLEYFNSENFLKQEKNPMKNVLDNVIARNKLAVSQAGTLTAGKTINTVVLDKVTPFLPEAVQGYAATPLGQLVVANVVATLVSMYSGSKSHKLQQVSQYMVDAAVNDIVASINIDQMISDFLSNDAIANVLDQMEVPDESN